MIGTRSEATNVLGTAAQRLPNLSGSANSELSSNGGRVLIQVFNEQGKLMITVLNGVMAPGSYAADIDLGEMPSGVYYARFQNEGLQQVKNMLKVR